ncbi:Hsp20/alpha crystallin family protein [Myxosarcina sp. GI1(2024)]
MDIVRFSPFGRMELLRKQIDRVFADIENTAQDNYSTWTPAIELLDDSDNLILRMQLAGVEDKDLDIQVTRESVAISGKRNHLQGKSTRYLHSEFNYGSDTYLYPYP